MGVELTEQGKRLLAARDAQAEALLVSLQDSDAVATWSVLCAALAKHVGSSEDPERLLKKTVFMLKLKLRLPLGDC